MYLDILTLVFVVISIAGSFLVIRRHPASYYFWTVSNAGLVAVNIYKGDTVMMALFAFLLALSVYGVWSERRRRNWGYRRWEA